MQGKRIIVAGLAGRVGGSIAESLIADNEVFGFDLFFEPGSRQAWEAKGVHTVAGDRAQGDFGDLPRDVDYCIDLIANTTPGDYRIGLEDNVVGTARMMEHARAARAYLTFSSTSVYTLPEVPDTPLAENDLVGAKTLGFYPGSKIATEGAVRALAVHVGLPSIVVRLATFYGLHGDGGLFVVNYLNCLVNDLPIELLDSGPFHMSPIYSKDIDRFIEPLLAAASLTVPIVNLGGDEHTTLEELVRYLGELIGVTPRFESVPELPWPSMVTDPTLRRSITGPCRYGWRAGVRELVAHWYPILLAERAHKGTGRFDQNTRIKEVLKLPGILQLIERHTGMKLSPITLRMGANMTLKKASGYLRWSPDQLQVVIDDLNALAAK